MSSEYKTQTSMKSYHNLNDVEANYLFPRSPKNGDKHIVGDCVYVWDAYHLMWRKIEGAYTSLGDETIPWTSLYLGETVPVEITCNGDNAIRPVESPIDTAFNHISDRIDGVLTQIDRIDNDIDEICEAGDASHTQLVEMVEHLQNQIDDLKKTKLDRPQYSEDLANAEAFMDDYLETRKRFRARRFTQKNNIKRKLRRIERINSEVEVKKKRANFIWPLVFIAAGAAAAFFLF